ncbi:MAG TPA: AMP-binding protein [Pseudobdellovibrionaceae bacterium]|nr:AMP-binding protein [Pseudobdellovibrionaceae bacterium]
MSTLNAFGVNEFMASIAREATLAPDAVAIEILIHSSVHQRLSYAELTGSTWAAADTLQRQRLRRAAILCERSLTRYLSVLSCAWAGTEVLPLSTDWPEARIIYALDDFQPDVIWVDQHLASRCHRLLGQLGVWSTRVRVHSFDSSLNTRADSVCDHLHALVKASPTHKAELVVSQPLRPFYRVMTSGSTGRPKCIPIHTHNFQSYWRGLCAWHRLSRGQRVSQIFDLSFDLAWHDLFSTWSRGATLVVPTRPALLHPTSFLRDAQLDELFMTPTWAAAFLLGDGAANFELPQLQRAMFCGEALSRDVLQAARRAFPRAEIWNLYGPSEATVAVTHFNCSEEFPAEQSVVPIGRAFGDNLVEVVHDELRIAGPQVSVQSIKAARSDLPAEASQLNWLATGDRAQWSSIPTTESSGAKRDEPASRPYLNFCGRVDRQVKVRGYRLELGEVEAQARRCAQRIGLRFIGLQVELLDDKLVAIYARGEEARTSSSKPTDSPVAQPMTLLITQLKSALLTELPQYAVPQLWYEREDWPLTSSGKTDLQANRAWVVSRLGI